MFFVNLLKYKYYKLSMGKTCCAVNKNDRDSTFAKRERTKSKNRDISKIGAHTEDSTIDTFPKTQSIPDHLPNFEFRDNLNNNNHSVCTVNDISQKIDVQQVDDDTFQFKDKEFGYGNNNYL